MKRAALARALLPPLLLLLAAGCERSKPAAPATAAAATEKLAPWTWRPMGGFMVIEGELAAPAKLMLEGPNMRLETAAGAGPVRWELAKPAAGERAELRTSAGRILARWTFEEPARTRRRNALPSGPLPHGERAAAFRGDPAPPQVREEASPNSTEPVAGLIVPPSFTLPAPRAGLVLAPETRLPSTARPTAPLPAPAFPGAGEGLNLVHGPKAGRKLVLTFDGGSGAESAAEILDTLKARHVRTTFFLTAPFIQKFPGLVRRMAAEGHELGNHTTTHPHLAPRMRRDPNWTKARVQAELLEADSALVRLLGRPMNPYWRAPYGEHTADIRRWAEEIGYRHVGWSEGADSLDWATPSERRLYRSGGRILDKLHGRLQKPDGGGLIVLMHLGSGRDEEDRPSKGLGAFMDRAMKEGWRFASIGDTLRDMGKPAWDPAARMAWLEPSLAGASRGVGHPR